jgi:hypothetical protein
VLSFFVEKLNGLKFFWRIFLWFATLMIITAEPLHIGKILTGCWVSSNKDSNMARVLFVTTIDVP